MITELSKVIERCDGQTALANKLKRLRPNSKIRQGHINNWLKRDKAVPPEWVIPLCVADDWQSTPHAHRPDLYPHPQDGLPEELRHVA